MHDKFRHSAGQAMIEFALGLFIFALILSALFAFAEIIPKCTETQSLVRKLAGRDAETGGGSNMGSYPSTVGSNLGTTISQLPAVELVRQQLDFTVDFKDFGAEYLLGTPDDSRVHFEERALIPAMTIPSVDITAFEEGVNLL